MIRKFLFFVGLFPALAWPACQVNQYRNVNVTQTTQTCDAGGAGTPIPIIYNSPVVVTAIPGASGTIDVQYTTSKPSAVTDGTATWVDWNLGTVSATASDTTVGPVTGIRQTPGTSAGTIELVQ